MDGETSQPINKEPLTNSEASGFVERVTSIKTIAYSVSALLIVLGGWLSIQGFGKAKVPPSKLMLVAYYGDWVQGEYRRCHWIQILSCEDSIATATDSPRLFKVSFSGEVTIDSDLLCRRNSEGDLSFSCVPRETVKEALPFLEILSSQPAPTISKGELEDFIELQNLNECEARFFEKKIFKVNGVDVSVACKKNPKLVP